MSFTISDPVSTVVESVLGIVDKFIPDTAARDSAKASITTLLVTASTQSDTQQAAIDTTEAASTSLFVSGWRPFIGWTCGLAFAGHYTITPSFMFLRSCWQDACAAPVYDMTELNTVLWALLGIGGMRTVDKTVRMVMGALK